MASLLFDINKKGTEILRPEAVQLCPELAFLKEKELLFIILTYDYASPYHQFPEEDRIRKAIHHVYGNEGKDPSKARAVKDGIKAYMSLQYDSSREQIKMYQRKVVLINRELEGTTNAATIKGQMATIKELSKAIKEIRKEIDIGIEKEEAKIRGGGVLSFLEKMQSNKEAYEEIIRGK